VWFKIQIKIGIGLRFINEFIDILQCEKYDVTGYPALKFFQNGKETSEYDGVRKVCNFASAYFKGTPQ
jgi:hypothetical protein